MAKKNVVNASNQDMFLGIVNMTAFPEMDSARIINDLKNHRELWLACGLEKDGVWKDEGGSLSISLGDFFSARGKEDTLGICSSNADNEKLFELANQWGADTIQWKPKRTEDPNELVSLKLKWNRKY